VVEKPPFFMGRDCHHVIHVNYVSASIDPVYYPQREVIGDIANSICRLSAQITPQDSWDFSYFLDIKQQIESDLEEGADKSSFPICPQRLVSEVRKVMPADGILTLDNGIYKIWFSKSYKAYQPNTILLDNALASMGAGLPSAIAASLIYPERKIVAVCGDGGFMMNSQELETAIRLNLNIIVLILCDNAYGMIKWKQDQMGFVNFGLDFKNPDFVKYAESYGANGYRITTSEDLATVLSACFTKPGVHVIEVAMDYADNDKIMG